MFKDFSSELHTRPDFILLFSLFIPFQFNYFLFSIYLSLLPMSKFLPSQEKEASHGSFSTLLTLLANFLSLTWFYLFLQYATSHKASQTGNITAKKNQSKTNTQTRTPKTDLATWDWQKLDITYWTLDNHADSCPLTLLIMPWICFRGRLWANLTTNPPLTLSCFFIPLAHGKVHSNSIRTQNSSCRE